MKKIIVLALFWAGCAATFGQGLSFKDDFSGYADGPPPQAAWDVIAGSGQWTIQNKKLIALGEGGLCHTRRVPELDMFDYVARLVINRRSTTSDWVTAGITVSLDSLNQWRLNLVEGPGGKRYTEFGEMFQGRWQAQNEGSTKLRKSLTEFNSGEWQYAKEYLLRIKLSAKEIYGEVSEADSGRVIAQYRYFWDDAEGLKFGRPGFSANGFSITCSSVAVTAGQPAVAGRAGLVENGPAGRVALLANFPGADPAQVDTLAAALRKAGFGATFLTGKDLALPGMFSTMNFDYVVLAGSHFFPSQAKDNFLRFLRNGGHCVVLGGNVFEEPVVQLDGRWYSRADVERELAKIRPETMLLNLAQSDTHAWWRGSDMPKAPSAITVQDKGLRFDIRGLKGWDTFSASIPPFQKGQTLLCFRAKGDAATPQMTVEVDEKDGSRWIATVELTPDWNSYAVPPDRFAPWEAKAISKKGNFKPADAAKLSFGLVTGFNPRVAKGDHAFWIDVIGTASNRLGRIDLSQKVELNFFYDYEPYRLSQVVTVGSAPQNTVTAAIPPVRGSFSGLAAIGFAFQNESKFIPLLSTFDQYGRDRGWAGGMLVNYGGTYRGSSWIFFGITNQEFYTEPAVLETITGAMKAAKGNLVQLAQAENAQAKATVIKLVTPAPRGFIQLSPDGKHLVQPNGQRFFMSGCNYIGAFDRCGGRMWRDDYFSAAAVEEDFRKAHDAGLNSMRYWLSGIDKDIMQGDFRKSDVIRECARKYGIYLLIDLPGTGYATVEEMVASHKAIASAFKDEPMVLGYDLRNEPHVATVAGIKYPEGHQPPILTQNLLGQHPELTAKLVHNLEIERPEWLHLPRRVNGHAAENAIAAIYLWEQYVRKYNIGSATMPGMVNHLPVDEQYRDVVAVVDKSFAQWLRLQIEAIRAVDTHHLITVGYDTVCACLPANRQLDFISQHVYARPYSLKDVLENVNTFDRLAVVWPGKPITFGEFGYTMGIPMPDGYLDRYTASVGEMMHYLYAFANNYDGVKKWMLVDWPFKIMQHYGDWNKGTTTRTYEERFGMYYYDGTPAGRPKPIVPALRFFGDYIRGLAPSGALDMTMAPLSIGAGYVYHNTNAFFVGNTSYASANFEFTAEHPANVMLHWNEAGLRVMASADARVKIKPAGFGNFGKTVTGTHGALKTDGETLTIEMLEGETLWIR